MAITITDSAKEQLDQYFADKKQAPIRIFVASGCGGQMLALALDNPGEGDTTEQSQGYEFVMNEELAGEAGDVSIDVGPMGFAVDSDLVFEAPEASGCGGCTGCG